MAFSPASSLAGGHDAIPAKAKKCKKGYVRKGHRCVKKPRHHKPAPSNVPADGRYGGNTTDFGLTMATASGKRNVSAVLQVQVTCPSGSTSATRFSVRDMPLTGTTFQGTSSDPQFPEFGTTTMTGKFLNAKTVQLHAQVTGYQNGSQSCDGQIDVTETLKPQR